MSHLKVYAFLHPHKSYLHAFFFFLQYGINSWVTHVASSCSSICGSKYSVKMFEVPVNCDPAKEEESGALFAYVQSAAFLTFCETWSLSYTLHYLWPTCLKCPQYKATPPACSKFIKAHPIPFSFSPPDSPYHRSMLMLSSIWVESPVQQATVEENNNTDPSGSMWSRIWMLRYKILLCMCVDSCCGWFGKYLMSRTEFPYIQK